MNAAIGLAGAIGVGLVFAQSALVKLLHRELVPGVVANYRLLPEWLVGPVATVLPLAELAIGLALLAGGQRLAVLPAMLLLLVFAGAMAINIKRGRSFIDCGCGRAQLRQPLSLALVLRNLVLALLIAPRLLPASPAEGADVAVALAGGVSLFLVYTLFNAIAALASSPLSTAMAHSHPHSHSHGRR